MASVPAGHPYVRSVTDPNRLELLPDPVPPEASTPGQWWPPRLLDAAYLSTRTAEFDLCHVHFGFDTAEPAQLADMAAVLAEAGIPLVVTVHDLHNPHFVDARDHSARLDVLIPSAAAIITLTRGAAEEIHRRWGRQAVVLPHPHVLPIDEVGPARRVQRLPVVGVHAKSLRANIDVRPVLDALISAQRADWQLRLDIDDDAFRAARADELTDRRLDDLRHHAVDVRVHPPFTDDELTAYLGEVDVLVLPYRFGTHSGWVEACHDAGVSLVVSDCGYLHEQQSCRVFHYSATGFDSVALIDAVHAAAATAQRPAIADVGRRQRRDEQRREVRRRTVELYRQLLSQAAVA